MACCGRNKGTGGNNGKGPEDLSRYAYLTPRQLRILQVQQKNKDDEKEKK